MLGHRELVEHRAGDAPARLVARRGALDREAVDLGRPADLRPSGRPGRDEEAVGRGVDRLAAHQHRVGVDGRQAAIEVDRQHGHHFEAAELRRASARRRRAPAAACSSGPRRSASSSEAGCGASPSRSGWAGASPCPMRAPPSGGDVELRLDRDPRDAVVLAGVDEVAVRGHRRGHPHRGGVRDVDLLDLEAARRVVQHQRAGASEQQLERALAAPALSPERDASRARAGSRARSRARRGARRWRRRAGPLRFDEVGLVDPGLLDVGSGGPSPPAVESPSGEVAGASLFFLGPPRLSAPSRTGTSAARCRAA